MGPAFAGQAAALRGRTMLVRKATWCRSSAWCAVIWPVGLEGISARGNGVRAGHPRGAARVRTVARAIFTRRPRPSRARRECVVRDDGSRHRFRAGRELRSRSVDLYRRAAAHAEGCGILLADTKFEWGQLPDGNPILIDEVLTPTARGSGLPSRIDPRESAVLRQAIVARLLEQAGWTRTVAAAVADDVAGNSPGRYDSQARTASCRGSAPRQ